MGPGCWSWTVCWTVRSDVRVYSVWICWSDSRGFCPGQDTVRADPSTSSADCRSCLPVGVSSNMRNRRHLQSTGEDWLARASTVHGAGKEWWTGRSAGGRSSSSSNIAGVVAWSGAAASDPVQNASTLLLPSLVSLQSPPLSEYTSLISTSACSSSIHGAPIPIYQWRQCAMNNFQREFVVVVVFLI